MLLSHPSSFIIIFMAGSLFSLFSTIFIEEISYSLEFKKSKLNALLFINYTKNNWHVEILRKKYLAHKEIKLFLVNQTINYYYTMMNKILE